MYDQVHLAQSRPVPSKTAAVPYYYIPETDITAGPARVVKESKDTNGFWLGTIRTGAGTAEAQGYDKGPLQGFVKVKVSDIGQSSSFGTRSHH